MFSSFPTSSRRVPVVILLFLLASGGCKRSSPPSSETVEMVVAAKDLPVAPAPRVKGTSLPVPEGMEPYSLMLPADDAAAGFALGTRVDVVARYQRRERIDTFALIENVPVLEVKTNVDIRCYGDWALLTVPVDETQEVLLSLAEKSGCHLKVVRRQPDQPLTLTKDDHARRIKYFRDARAENQPEVAPAPRVKAWGLTLPAGLDIMTLPVPEGGAAAGFIVPGSRVDVIGTLKRGNKTEAFPLVDGVLVVAVNTEVGKRPTDAMRQTLSLAVDRDQALLLVLARERGCRLDAILRGPGKRAATTKDEYKKRLKFVQELPEATRAPRGK